jgi:anti-sigma regulatory factor (Ser/Thr protein kinase)
VLDLFTPSAAHHYPVTYRSRFDVTTLTAVRGAVSRCLSTMGGAPDRAGDVILAVGEMLSNAIRHGGGAGEVQLIRTHHHVLCVVRDEGRGMPDGADFRHPRLVAARSVNGRGLWLASFLSTAMRVYSSRVGTRVDLIIDWPQMVSGVPRRAPAVIVDAPGDPHGGSGA